MHVLVGQYNLLVDIPVEAVMLHVTMYTTATPYADVLSRLSLCQHSSSQQQKSYTGCKLDTSWSAADRA